MSDENDKIPEPDENATDAEKARAESFASLLDDMVDGKPSPAAMAADERELLTAATMIHASTNEAELDASKRDELINKAFQQTLPEQVRPEQLRSVDDASADSGKGSISSLAELRERKESKAKNNSGQKLPWLIAAVAAAAAVFFALNPPTRSSKTATRVETRIVDTTPVSAQHRSRPADPLIGRIANTQSAAASQRLDRIFSDRMSGYRDLRLRRRARITQGGKK